MSNVFFNNFMNTQEQTLLEDLIIESISIFGHDAYYCPRTIVAKDDIFGEDTVSIYNSAYFIDLYIKSFDSYEGDGQFLSKFNLEIRDQMRFNIAIRKFNEEVGAHAELERPREGDLIWSPMMNRLFVVMYVNNKPTFYQMGALQLYELTCEVFEYSNERLNTGIAEIDSIEDQHTTDLGAFGLVTNDGFTLTDEDGFAISQGQYNYETQNQDTYADNTEFEIEDEEDEIIDWSSINPFTTPIT